MKSLKDKLLSLFKTKEKPTKAQIKHFWGEVYRKLISGNTDVSLYDFDSIDNSIMIRTTEDFEAFKYKCAKVLFEHYPNFRVKDFFSSISSVYEITDDELCCDFTVFYINL